MLPHSTQGWAGDVRLIIAPMFKVTLRKIDNPLSFQG